MFAAAMAAVLVTMMLALLRGALGPTVYDRLLAVNSFGTATVLFIAVLGFLAGRPDFLDLSLLYALINFISTIAVLKYFKFGDLADAAAAESLERAGLSADGSEIARAQRTDRADPDNTAPEQA